MTMDPLLLISLLVFLSILIIGWGIYAFMQSRQKMSDWNAENLQQDDTWVWIEAFFVHQD